jgi:hypothetical protein
MTLLNTLGCICTAQLLFWLNLITGYYGRTKLADSGFGDSGFSARFSPWHCARHLKKITNALKEMSTSKGSTFGCSAAGFAPEGLLGKRRSLAARLGDQRCLVDPTVTALEATWV